jgi:hypothetical protein
MVILGSKKSFAASDELPAGALVGMTIRREDDRLAAFLASDGIQEAVESGALGFTFRQTLPFDAA